MVKLVSTNFITPGKDRLELLNLEVLLCQVGVSKASPPYLMMKHQHFHYACAL